MKTIEIEKIREDKRDYSIAYIFYGDAKEAGIKKGVQFGLNDGGKEVFEAVEYITFRPDVQQTFKGFRCRMVA